MAERRIYYGGQAVIEGVMIRGPRSMAIACRKPDGDIIVRRETLGGVYAGPIRRFPLLRGAIVMWETLALGLRALVFSSGVQLGDEKEQVQSGPVWFAAMVSLVAVGAIFFAGPLLLANLLDSLLDNHLLVIVIEGFIRLGVVVGYVGLVGLLPDIRRVYAYHGAEHKTIHAMEHGDPLEPAYVQRYPTAHVRCGTSFLLTVVVVSIVVFAIVGTPDLWQRVVSRIILIPVIAAISYEVIRLAGAFESNPITKVLMSPNLALQILTTRQPDDAQVEVAIRALEEVLAAEQELAPKPTASAAAAEAAPPVD